MGLKPVGVQYGRVAKGYALEVMGETYDTPYGRVTDWSKQQQAQNRELRNEAKAHGFGNNVEEFVQMSKWASNLANQPKKPEITITTNQPQVIEGIEKIKNYNKNLSGSQVGVVRNTPYSPPPTFLDNLKQVPKAFFGLDNQTITNLKSIGSDIKTSFGIDKAQNFTMSALNNVERNLQTFINPPTTQEKVLDAKNKIFEQQVKQYERNVNQFNTLPPEQQTEDLSNYLNRQRTALEYQQRALTSEARLQNIQRENDSMQVTKSLLTGFATAPIVNARFLASPVQSTKDFFTGITQLPSEFRERPSTTFGTLVGQVGANVFMGEAFGLGGSSRVVTTTRYKPRVTLSKSVSNSVKVGNVGDDVSLFVNKAQLTTRRVSPITGRLINEIKTDVRGVFFAKKLPNDFIMTGSRSVGQSYTSKGIKISPDKISNLNELVSAKSQGVFKFAEGGETGLGYVLSSSRNVGKVKFKATPNEASLQFIKTKLPERYSTFSKVNTKKVSTIEGDLGTIDTSLNVARSLSRKSIQKISGYTRDNLKVSPYLRKTFNPKTRQADLMIEKSRTFTPKEQSAESPTSFRIVSDKKTPFSQTFAEEQAKASFLGDVASIEKSLISKASKPIVKTTTKTTEGSFVSGVPQSQYYGKGQYETTQFGSPTSAGILKPIEETRISVSNISEPKIKGGLIGGSKLDEGLDKSFPNFFPRIKDIDLNKIKDNQKDNQKQGLGLKQQTQQQQKSLSLSTANQVNFRPTRPTNQTPKPKEKIKIRLPSEDTNKKKIQKLIKTATGETFFGITKRHGKEFVVSRGTDPLKVSIETKKYVLSNLSASLRVVSSKGRQLKLQEDRFFRTSKRDPLKLVQAKRGSGSYRGRLSSLGERQEIKYLRNKRKNKFF